MKALAATYRIPAYILEKEHLMSQFGVKLTAAQLDDLVELYKERGVVAVDNRCQDIIMKFLSRGE